MRAGRLAEAVGRFLDGLVDGRVLRPDQRTAFTGRAVIAPAVDLRYDQIGLPEEMAWTLFGPLAARKVGAEAVGDRSARAAAALDGAMAASWVLVTRAPAILPTSIVGFRPVRRPERVIRLHPVACRALNADYDGDQSAVLLPLTAGAQREAAEKLSLAGHLRRMPEIVEWLVPSHDPAWGLAELSRTAGGLAEIRELATAEVAAPEGFVTRRALADALREVLDRDGAERALEVLERMMDRGFEVAKESGASLCAFVAAAAAGRDAPDGADPKAWEAYREGLVELVSSWRDFDDDVLGVQVLSVKSGARGQVSQLCNLVGGCLVQDVARRIVGQRGCLAAGLTPREYYTRCAGARRGLAQVAFDVTRRAYGVREAQRTGAFTVLARAMRSARPGMVFAHAAAIGEVDPLTDPESRLFVGLAP